MMDQMELRVYFALRDGGVDACVESAEAVAGLGFDAVSLHPGEESDVPDRYDSLVVCDDAARLNSISASVGSRVLLVYCGSGPLDCMPANLVDVWPADEAPDMRAWRFQKLLERIRASFGSWLYRTWLNALIDGIPDLVWFKDNDGLHNWVNEPFCKTVGKTREDCKDKHHNYIWDVPPEDWEVGALTCMESEEKVVAQRRTLAFEESVSTESGMKHLTVYKSPVFDAYGDIIGTVGLGHDVTNFDNMGRELSLLMESMPFPLILLDQNRKTARVNMRAAETFGLDPEDPASLDYGVWKEEMFEEIECVTKGEGKELVRVQKMVSGPEGGERYYRVTEQPIYDIFDSISGYYCLINDVTAEHCYEQQLAEMANTDALTKLRNRRFFYNYIKAHAQDEMTVFYLDLDHFKQVNDSFGHARGDEVLVAAAHAIADSFPDGMDARLGGDEFAAVMLGALSDKEVAQLTDGARKAVADKLAEYDVTVSIGVGHSSGAETDLDEFLQLCDQLMYEDKRSH